MMTKNTPVSLGDHFAGFVNSQVQSGRYGSAGDVVRTQLRLLDERETNVKSLQDALIKGERSVVPQRFDRDGFLKNMHDKQTGRGWIASIIRRAESNLEGIWLCAFETRSVAQADNHYSGSMHAIELLAAGERQGREVDAREGCLKHPVGKHQVHFCRSDCGIEVIRILRQRMEVNLHW